MENIIEYVGNWYLPNKKDKKVHGVLKISSKNRVSLEIYGSLTKLSSFQDIEDIDIINGFTTEGKKVTLINNSQEEFSVSIPGIVTNKYESQYVIIGHEYKSIEEIIVHSLTCNYTDLSKWINIYGLSKRYENDKLIVEYEKPENLTYKLNDYIINMKFEFKHMGNLYDEMTITQNTRICFEELKDKNFVDILDRAFDFSRFLTLCIGEKILPYNIDCVDIKGRKIFVIINGLDKIENSNKKTRDMLIPYNFIDTKFEECISEWNMKREKLEPVIDYIVDSYEKVFHIPMSFIKLVQAIEAFSRRMRNNCKISPVEHQNKIDYILGRIDNIEYKEWLEQKLKHSNEPTLQKRLKELFKELNFILKLNSSTRDSISNNIANTRNYYTHFDESKKDSIMNSGQVFYISKYILIMLRVLIMKELGLEEKDIKSQLDNSQDIKYIVNEINKNFKIK